MKKERKFLQENYYSKDNTKGYLLEFEGGAGYLEKCKQDENLPVYLVGIIQKGDTPNRNGRIYPFAILKKECDRYMKEEIKDGQSFGECFSEGHKIMTRLSGWVDFKDLNGDEEVATMNPLTKEFEWQKIQRKVEYDYEGEMIRLKNRSIDSLITLNHKVPVCYIDNKIKFEKIEAHKLNTRHIIPRKCVWSKEKKEIIIIENEFGRLEILSNLFSQLTAWYLAEGWFKSNESISISQCKEDGINEITDLFDKLKLESKISSRDGRKNIEYNFTIKNKILAKYFSQFGKSFDKYIPEEIKEMDSENIDLFLQTYSKADGIRGNKYDIFYSVSKKLSYDLMELCYKSNSSASISEKEQFDTFITIENVETKEAKEIIDFEWYTSKEYLDKEKYEIVDKRKESRGTLLYSVTRLSRDFIRVADCLKENEYYKGKVYCVEVPNHIILIHKGNSSYWSGNCDHPAESSVPELKNASHTIEDIWYKGTEVWAKIKLLNAYMPEIAPGKIARGIVLNGKTLGISSRALGSVYSDQSGYDVVDEDLEIICWDLVSRPSTYDANLRLAESKKSKKVESAYLTEKKCIGPNCNIITSKLIIKENKLKGLSREEKVYLDCMGVEKFLQLKNKK